MVVARAAIMFSGGEVIEGKNYGNILLMASKLGVYGEKIHGFVDSAGEFVLPIDAIDIAKQSGQINPNATEITPEEIWGEPIDDRGDI